MPNANIEFAHPKRRLFSYGKISLLDVLLRFAPSLVDRIIVYRLTERLLEYPFIHQNIPFGGEGKILDVGSGSSLLPLELAATGYQVWAIDLRKQYHRSIRHNNFIFVCGDIRKTNFPDAFFDAVTAVSSIEHVGFGSSETNFSGDKDACQEILRILKPEGKFLLTVPFGLEGVYSIKGRSQWSARLYNLPSLKKLLASFEIEQIAFALLDRGGWRRGSLKEVENVDSLSQPKWYSSKTVAMIIARK